MFNVKPHSSKDIPLRVCWLNNPRVSVYVGDSPNQKTNLTKESKWFASYQKNKQKKFFTIYVGKTPIGFMGLSNINLKNRNADIFIAIGEDEYRGRGFGKLGLEWLISYGFTKLKLHKINLGVIDTNVSAIKLYKKIGFKVEGRMKDEVFVKGKWQDMLSMAIFEKDWNK
jgi:RimJ/RimL family protein N-acetyltransferase